MQKQTWITASLAAAIVSSCGSEEVEPSSSGPPELESAEHALQDGDLRAAYNATLHVTATWRFGYCTIVRVANATSAPVKDWSVAIELHGTRPWGIWGARTTRDGDRLLASPLHGWPLRPGASAWFGFCGTRSDPNALPEIAPPASDDTTNLTVAVYIPRVIDTCFIGDPCEPGSADCTGLVSAGEVLVEGFTSESFAAVPTTSPRRATANKEICLQLTMSDADYASVRSELESFRENVRLWSNDDIHLDLRILDFERVDMSLSRWGGGFWIAPPDFQEIALSRLDFLPDFNMIIAPVGDPERGLSHWIGGCGGAYGADFGIAGGGWTWVPKSTSLNYDCGTQPTITHEWLHQVHFAYREVSRFQDLYGDTFPACGEGGPDPHRWFPDSHQCVVDPDFMYCGAEDCGSNDLVNAHILGEHWDPAFAFYANHCKNGVQDFDELSVDSGPSCSLTLAR